jgi:hypothetical protein
MNCALATFGGVTELANFATPLARALDWLSARISENQLFLNWLSHLADAVRKSPVSNVVAFFAFGLFTVRKSISNIPKYYDYLLMKNPLPAYRRLGITDDHILKVRQVIFFYLLYLIYQVIQFPLRFGSASEVPFYADLIFQTAITGIILFQFNDVRRELIQRWADDPMRQEQMKTWVNTKFEGLNLRFDELRGNALNVFALSFAPALFVALPAVARALVTFLDALSGWIKSLIV